MKKKTLYFTIILLFLLIAYFYKQGIFSDTAASNDQDKSVVITLLVPSDRFPETTTHIKSAIEHGESSICTIDRKGAEENRKESLKGVPTKHDFDRDEFPMAMCAEGGKGADIAYINPSDNRGAGSWISNQLEKYPDGSRVRISVK